MKKDITLQVKDFSDGPDEKYCITSKSEIGFMLRNIADKGSRVALYYGNENDFIMTTILDADSQGLWLERSQDGMINQKISGTNNLTIVGSHHNVKVQFTAELPTLVEHHGYPAFFISLPDKLFRMQRREYFRLMIPAIQPLKCVIPRAQQPIKVLREVTIMDISGGGIALTCEEQDTELVPGESYPNCRIDLPEFGTIIGTIVVRNLALLTDATGHNYKRAGCELQNMDNPSVVMLQRYVMHLQRAINSAK